MTDRPTILATAPLRGPGLDILRSLGVVIEDPWISESSMRLYNAEQLAARIAETGATIVLCEADKCGGPVLDLPLVAPATRDILRKHGNVAVELGDVTGFDLDARLVSAVRPDGA